MKLKLRDGVTLEPVEAELLSPVSSEDLVEAESKWVPRLRDVYTEMVALGQIERVYVWQSRWKSKDALLNDPNYLIIGIRASNQVQGLAKLIVKGHASKVDGNLPIVYIDFVESAPWNVKRYMDAIGQNQRFKDTGLELLKAAIRHSVDIGCQGRVGLHSLVESEGFYRCAGMTEHGKDGNKNGLVYFEFATAEAMTLIGETQ
ncbi:MAG: hypothetical protein GC165_13115 [Armatimonadetes bacterium]|nr:hypothetical protein [Armatimonadota bacterium]